MDTLIAWIAEYRYFIIFPLTIAEGPVVMMLGGFLLRLDMFDFWPLYLVLMAGDLTADAIWYAVGRFGGMHLVKRYGKYVGLTEEVLQKTEAAFHRHHNKILFVSKITMGLGLALVVLVTAGIMRVPFRKYLTFNALGQIVWTALLMAVGYFFGSLYLVVHESLRILTIVAFSVVAFGALYGFSRYLRTRDLDNL